MPQARTQSLPETCPEPLRNPGRVRQIIQNQWFRRSQKVCPTFASKVRTGGFPAGERPRTGSHAGRVSYEVHRDRDQRRTRGYGNEVHRIPLLGRPNGYAPKPNDPPSGSDGCAKVCPTFAWSRRTSWMSAQESFKINGLGDGKSLPNVCFKSTYERNSRSKPCPARAGMHAETESKAYLDRHSWCACGCANETPGATTLEVTLVRSFGYTLGAHDSRRAASTGTKFA